MKLQHSRLQSSVLKKWAANRFSILNRTFVSELLLNSFFSEPVKVIVKERDEFVYGNAFPISTIKDSVFDDTEESLTR